MTLCKSICGKQRCGLGLNIFVTLHPEIFVKQHLMSQNASVQQAANWNCVTSEYLQVFLTHQVSSKILLR